MNGHTETGQRGGALFLILAAVGTALATLGGMSLVVMLILPALWTHAALRMRMWALPLLALETLVLAYAGAGAWQPALLLWILVALPGVAMCLLQKYKFGNFYTTFFSSVLLAAGLYACICGPSLLAGDAAFTGVRRMMMAAGETLRPLYEASGNAALFETVFTAGALDEAIGLIGVPTLYVFGAVLALSNVLLMHAMNRRGGAELCPLSPFAAWRVPRAFANIFFFLMLAGLVATFTGSELGTALAYTVFVVWVMPMALVGLSVIYGGKKRLAPVIVLAALCVPLYTFVPPALAVVGMLGSRVRLGGTRGNGGEV